MVDVGANPTPMDPRANYTSERTRLQRYFLILLAIALLAPPLLILGIGGWLINEGLAVAKHIVFPLDVKLLNCIDPSFAGSCLKVIQQGYVYGIAWLLCVVLSAGATIFAGVSIWQNLAPVPRTVALILAFSLAIFFSIHFWGEPRLYTSFGSETFKRTLFHAIDPSWLDVKRWLNWSLDIANAATAWGATFVAVACCMTIVDLPLPTSRDTDAINSWGESLRVRLLWLRRYITAGAIILVAGIIDASQYMSWPTPLLDISMQPGYNALISGLLTMQGGTYSLMLLLVFIGPATTIYLYSNRRAAALPIPSITGFLADHGINLALPKFLPELVSIAAPLISAPIITLLHFPLA